MEFGAFLSCISTFKLLENRQILQFIPYICVILIYQKQKKYCTSVPLLCFAAFRLMGSLFNGKIYDITP
jgi:hypothetical protein